MTGELRVLIVDDSKDDAELVRRTLERSGFDAHCVRVDALEDLTRAITECRWDLIACDIRMPCLDAAQVVGMAHAAMPSVPIVLLAGAYSQHLWHELGSGIVTRFVSKEQIDQLPELIRTLLDAGERLDDASP